MELPGVQEEDKMETERQTATTPELRSKPAMAPSLDNKLSQEAYGTETSPASRWLRDARLHSASWAAEIASSETGVLAQQEKLRRLGEQLKCHEDYPACSEAENFLPGRGTSRPKIVFVSLHPSPHDHTESIAYSEGGWVSKFLSKLDDVSLSPASNCYLMYVFPYYLGKDREPTPEENDIFPRYALARIALLRPQIVVALGSRAGKYVFTGFERNKLCNAKRYSDVMRRAVVRGRPENPPGGTGYPAGTELLPFPHPFQLIPFLSSSQGQQARNNAFSQEAVDNFSACLRIIDKIVNRYKVAGLKVLDIASGTYVVDPVPAMRRAAAAIPTTPSSQKSATKAKNKPLGRGQSVLDRFVKSAALLPPPQAFSASAKPGTRTRQYSRSGKKKKVYHCKRPRIRIRLKH